MSGSNLSENNDADVKYSDQGISFGVQDDVVKEESRDSDSGISLTVQTSVLSLSSSVGTTINGVDFGVSVSVHIFCSGVA